MLFMYLKSLNKFAYAVNLLFLQTTFIISLQFSLFKTDKIYTSPSMLKKLNNIAETLEYQY